MYYKSIGKLRYGYTNLVLDIDPDIAKYYRKLIPKSIWLRPQKYDPHISVVRKEKTQPKMEFWRKYEGEKIEFIYSNVIRNSDQYYWLDVWSKRLEEIRTELGLINDSLFIKPLEGFTKTFHITLGNMKFS